ncbi:ubiquitin carboxyl-terminal hydrolase 37-like [Fundulus heteroclitus]|uniref:ubiquitin carboxyl-terminal hydrolase 37-like n=1 Tax=Fundulus heteroclitus TaxID=8078 RepID=UPI00165B5B26|nr:ubiquitin carboxyl-terminal hydrolase 37-like [Fundulus heteroclitus]
MRSVSSEVELTAVNSGLTYTCPVHEHISVQMLNIRTCRGCGEQSYRVEDFVNLTLELVPGGTVSQCLQEYFKGDQIDYTCHCGAQQSSLQSSFLHPAKNVITSVRVSKEGWIWGIQQTLGQRMMMNMSAKQQEKSCLLP